MVVLAEFAIDPETASLGELFRVVPDATIELERVVPTNTTLIPYIWVRGIDDRDVDQIEASLGRLSAIQRVELVDQVGGSYLFRIEWSSESDSILHAIADIDGTMVSGTGTRDTWTIELRCEHREDLTTFQECCERNDIRVELTALHDVTSAEVGDRYGLTAAQREAIVSSYERGYWQSPRETSLEELAAEFGISGQAFGSRLRRGLGRLIERTLVPRTEQSK